MSKIQDNLALAKASRSLPHSRADNLLNQAVRALNTLALFAEEHGAARLLREDVDNYNSVFLSKARRDT
jgi:hypothetical protein